MRIPINTEGHSDANLPRYAVMTEADDGRPLAAICRAIKRKTHHDIVTCRYSGTSDDRAQYDITLGQRIASGGWYGTGHFTVTI